MRDDSLSLPDRVDPLLRRKRFTRVSLSAFLHASEALAMAFGRKLGQMRDSGQSFDVYLARIEELEHRNRIHARVTPLLQARLRRVLAGKSDDYEDTERWEILQIRRDACLSQEETARLFLQSVSTIARWEREARNSPDRDGVIGTLLSPTPPLMRVADAVRTLIQAMALLGFQSPGMIARWLYRGGYEVSRAFVQTVLQEPPAAPLDTLSALVTPPPLAAANAPRAVTAKRPMHVALADVTDIPRSFGKPPLKLFAFYDVYSRLPLAWRLLESEPTAEDAVSLLDEVVAKHGKAPAHFVCDQGSYFKADAFQKRLAELGIKVRFGAIGQHGSIALIERFWKTEKGLLLPILPVDKALTRDDVLPRLQLSLDYYSHFRPHSSLGNKTPAEVFYGRPLPVPAPVRPPRGRPGDPCPDLGLTITYIDSEKLFPILLRKTA